jgi:hypothetical protein
MIAGMSELHRIELRVTSDDRQRWQDRANEQRLPLSSWIIQIVNLASQFQMRLTHGQVDLEVDYPAGQEPPEKPPFTEAEKDEMAAEAGIPRKPRKQRRTEPIQTTVPGFGAPVKPRINAASLISSQEIPALLCGRCQRVGYVRDCPQCKLIGKSPLAE